MGIGGLKRGEKMKAKGSQAFAETGEIKGGCRIFFYRQDRECNVASEGGQDEWAVLRIRDSMIQPIYSSTTSRSAAEMALPGLTRTSAIFASRGE